MNRIEHHFIVQLFRQSTTITTCVLVPTARSMCSI